MIAALRVFKTFLDDFLMDQSDSEDELSESITIPVIILVIK